MMILIIFTGMNLTSCAQNEPNILERTIEYTVPIDISEMIGKVHFDGKSVVLSEEECNMLNAFNENWLNESSYSYKSYCYFRLNENLIGIIYNRSFYPTEINNEKSEYILVIIDRDEKFISSIPVQGSYGDDEAFFGQINENFEIMITGEIFKENEKIERTKSIYIIKNDGVIE